MLRLGQFFGLHFQRLVMSLLQVGDAGGVDVKTDHGARFAKLDGQRQADIAEADDGKGKMDVVNTHFHSPSFILAFL